MQKQLKEQFVRCDFVSVGWAGHQPKASVSDHLGMRLNSHLCHTLHLYVLWLL